ncbi:MAG: universal stress protein [Dehalococcoidales bacterium]|nr:universal stress protein [Dehalococcoidales bacterium]
MFAKLLVPLDGSVLAEAALPYAAELAGKMGSEIILLYVSDPVNDPYRHMYDPYLQKMTEAVRDHVRRHLFPGKEPNVSSRILVGEAAEQIASYAENKDIDLIVMSSHGHNGFKRWTLGHITDKVIRNTIRPVAVIRSKGTTKEGIFRVMVTLDGSKVSEAALPYARELALGLKAELILFEVLTPDYYAYTNEAYKELAEAKKAARSYVEKIAVQMKENGVRTTAELREGLVSDTPEMIIRMIDEVGADTVVMATHGRSGLSRWALGSAAEKVLRGIEAPLILVKPPEAIKG